MGSIVTKVKKLATTTTVLSWDLVLVLINLLTPNHKPGWVVPKGHAGFHGEWPDFVAPKPGDSRSCCPALNAMANHGKQPPPPCSCVYAIAFANQSHYYVCANYPYSC